jgi:hypothetical protein
VRGALADCQLSPVCVDRFTAKGGDQPYLRDVFFSGFLPNSKHVVVADCPDALPSGQVQHDAPAAQPETLLASARLRTGDSAGGGTWSPRCHPGGAQRNLPGDTCVTRAARRLRNVSATCDQNES